MIAFLLISALSLDASQTSADPARDQAAKRCQAGIARRVKGEISNFAVDDYHRVGRSITVKGTFNLLQRPAVRPGEMTPTHVVSLGYSYDCRLNGRKAPRVRLSQVEN